MDISYFLDKIDFPTDAKDGVLEYVTSHDLSLYAKEIEGLLSNDKFIDSHKELVQKIGPDEHQRAILSIELSAALLTYERYASLGIPDEIFFDTMRVFTRYANLYKETNGAWGFDRGHWVPRHLCMRLFRLGTLEYEYTMKLERDAIAIHIPPDAVLTDDEMNKSFSLIRNFTEKFYPHRKDNDIVAQTWLTSPVLFSLLPKESKILSFARRFELVGCGEGEFYVYTFVFGKKDFNPQNDSIDTLPESTSLQRKIKELYRRGGRVGYGIGILKE